MGFIFIMGCGANLGATSRCIHPIPDKTPVAIGPVILDPAKVAIAPLQKEFGINHAIRAQCGLIPLGKTITL
jgi:hypothetical protein